MARKTKIEERDRERREIEEREKERGRKREMDSKTKIEREEEIGHASSRMQNIRFQIKIFLHAACLRQIIIIKFIFFTFFLSFCQKPNS